MKYLMPITAALFCSAFITTDSLKAQSSPSGASSLLSGAVQNVSRILDRSARTVGNTIEEVIYTTGDVVEFGYRIHPGAYIGRRLGLLKKGKLGLLPSHGSNSTHSTMRTKPLFFRGLDGKLYRF